mmetsp:Transcript_93332/g.243339  ORF Transcript_93332/g.243339 Transcript_93332/m.243339 type:complete len:230 (+) Transcript_93332:416-1105(+)
MCTSVTTFRSSSATRAACRSALAVRRSSISSGERASRLGTNTHLPLPPPPPPPPPLSATRRKRAEPVEDTSSPAPGPADSAESGVPPAAEAPAPKVICVGSGGSTSCKRSVNSRCSIEAVSFSSRFNTSLCSNLCRSERFSCRKIWSISCRTTGDEDPAGVRSSSLSPNCSTSDTSDSSDSRALQYRISRSPRSRYNSLISVHPKPEFGRWATTRSSPPRVSPARGTNR